MLAFVHRRTQRHCLGNSETEKERECMKAKRLVADETTRETFKDEKVKIFKTLLKILLRFYCLQI